jgi:hypothetical protein
MALLYGIVVDILRDHNLGFSAVFLLQYLKQSLRFTIESPGIPFLRFTDLSQHFVSQNPAAPGYRAVSELGSFANTHVQELPVIVECKFDPVHVSTGTGNDFVFETSVEVSGGMLTDFHPAEILPP